MGWGELRTGSFRDRLELPDQAGGDAAEIGGQARDAIGSQIQRACECEKGVLIACADAEGDAARDGGIQAAASEARKRGGLADCAVCRPGFAGASGPTQSIEEKSFLADMHGVLRAAEEEVRTLRRSQVGAEVSGGVDFETEAVPGVEGYRGIESTQRVVRAGYAVERVGEVAIAAVDLKGRWSLGAGLGVERRDEAKKRDEREKARRDSGPQGCAVSSSYRVGLGFGSWMGRV